MHTSLAVVKIVVTLSGEHLTDLLFAYNLDCLSDYNIAKRDCGIGLKISVFDNTISIYESQSVKVLLSM